MTFGSFSDAIRHGATLRPQGRCEIFAAGRSCAIGAGLEALGVPYRELTTRETLQIYHIAERAFPYLDTQGSCPVAGCRGYQNDSLLNIVWHLNDHHDYTREWIAEWLQSEEDKRFGYVTLTEHEQSESLSSTPASVGV